MWGKCRIKRQIAKLYPDIQSQAYFSSVTLLATEIFMNKFHLKLISELVAATEQLDMPIWIGGGWAIDARLGRVTRPHDDIDITFPAERKDEFIGLLESMGGRVTEETDYGFLAQLRGILLDCEPAHWVGNTYEVEDTPKGSCPMAFEGQIEGMLIRCNSWEAILWDYFYFADELPQAQWPAKHIHSYALVCSVLGVEHVQRLRATFDSK